MEAEVVLHSKSELALDRSFSRVGHKTPTIASEQIISEVLSRDILTPECGNNRTVTVVLPERPVQ